VFVIFDNTGILRLYRITDLDVMLGYDYRLSKRTDLYARAGSIRNYGISTILLNNNFLPTQPGMTIPETGKTPITPSLGMYHNF
jgi:predicted porin